MHRCSLANFHENGDSPQPVNGLKCHAVNAHGVMSFLFIVSPNHYNTPVCTMVTPGEESNVL